MCIGRDVGIMAHDGDWVPVKILLSGQFFGEVGLLTANGRRSAGAMARSLCLLLVIHRKDFQELCDMHPGFSREMQKVSDFRERKISEVQSTLMKFKEKHSRHSSEHDVMAMNDKNPMNRKLRANSVVSQSLISSNQESSTVAGSCRDSHDDWEGEEAYIFGNPFDLNSNNANRYDYIGGVMAYRNSSDSVFYKQLKAGATDPVEKKDVSKTRQKCDVDDWLVVDHIFGDIKFVSALAFSAFYQPVNHSASPRTSGNNSLHSSSRTDLSPASHLYRLTSSPKSVWAARLVREGNRLLPNNELTAQHIVSSKKLEAADVNYCWLIQTYSDSSNLDATSCTLKRKVLTQAQFAASYAPAKEQPASTPPQSTPPSANANLRFLHSRSKTCATGIDLTHLSSLSSITPLSSIKTISDSNLGLFPPASPRSAPGHPSSPGAPSQVLLPTSPHLSPPQPVSRPLSRATSQKKLRESGSVVEILQCRPVTSALTQMNEIGVLTSSEAEADSCSPTFSPMFVPSSQADDAEEKKKETEKGKIKRGQPPNIAWADRKKEATTVVEEEVSTLLHVVATEDKEGSREGVRLFSSRAHSDVDDDFAVIAKCSHSCNAEGIVAVAAVAMPSEAVETVETMAFNDEATEDSELVDSASALVAVEQQLADTAKDPGSSTEMVTEIVEGPSLTPTDKKQATVSSSKKKRVEIGAKKKKSAAGKKR